MLYRDIRKKQRRAAAQKAHRCEWLALNDKWSSCPNTGLTANSESNVNWTGENDLFFFPGVAFSGGGHMNILLCFGCHSMWSVATDYGTHP